jgi:DNA-binding NtrC family response regulator
MTRLLVVDDEPRYCAQLERELARAGYEVRTAHSGREAITLGARYHPDVLITDWMLRNHVDGLCVAQTLQSVLPDMRTIVITGFASADLRAQATAMRSVDFVEKPFGLQRLRHAVQRAERTARSAEVRALALLEVGPAGEVYHANRAAWLLLQQTDAGPTATLLSDVVRGPVDLEAAVGEWISVETVTTVPQVWHLRAAPSDAASRLVLIRPADQPAPRRDLVETLLNVAAPRAHDWPANVRVLLIDDHESVRAVIRRALAGCGAACYAVATASEGLRLLLNDEGIRVAIIDFDLDLPPIALRAALESIRRNRPDVQIIGTSAALRQAEFRELGVNDYLQKPWQSEELRALIRAAEPRR